MAEVPKLSDEQMDQVLAFFQALEEDQGWEEAVAKILMFHPGPNRVRQIKDRALERANKSRVEGDPGEETRWIDTADALSILADKAEDQEPWTVAVHVLNKE